MSLFTSTERRFVEAVSELAYCNPFLPRRIELERTALGDDFDEKWAEWNLDSYQWVLAPNVVKLQERAAKLLDGAREKLARKDGAEATDKSLYEDLALFVFYHRFREGFDRTTVEGRGGKPTRKRVGMYEEFAREMRRYVEMDDAELSHFFACFFQLRRAFHNIFNYIIGRSKAAVRLRADVWQSIFTHDMRRYRRVLFDRMADYATLITGPSGTGKELAAQAVGLSRYIPFDAKTQTFTEDFAGSFHPLNLAAMSPTLIESELFGHAKGAFTGALAERRGWLEICRPQGTVFLDEIGELDPAIQVKLLRVLQTRLFSRLGETQTREFHGKIIAATNKNLAQEMRTGRFRTDLYYRICSDIVVTPSLRQRIADEPGELRTLITHLASRMVGQDEAEGLSVEIERWIGENLGADYAWPGNVRELEQCVRNVLIRRSYRPAESGAEEDLESDARAVLGREAAEGKLTADELLGKYCTLIYHKLGSYEKAAEHLKLDRRTVKAKIDGAMLKSLEKN